MGGGGVEALEGRMVGHGGKGMIERQGWMVG